MKMIDTMVVDSTGRKYPIVINMAYVKYVKPVEKFDVSLYEDGARTFVHMADGELFVTTKLIQDFF